MRARLLSVDKVADDAAAFTFEPHDPFTFEAGQTCDLTIPAPKYQDDKGSARTFSIVSSPAELPRLKFATRLTGSAFKRTLLEGAPDLEVDLDGPYGSFTLHKNTAKAAMLFAGGIGITPFHSIIKDATERKLAHKITLFYSNTSPSRAAFLADLEKWQKENPNFHLVNMTMVDANLVKANFDVKSNAIAYVAGPPGFVGAVRSTLDSLGADPDNIRTEEFSGY
jgi:ferredoxin-NADP reductase